MNKYEYYYTSLNWFRTKLDKLNMQYEINSKERTIIIYSDLNREEFIKIIDAM